MIATTVGMAFRKSHKLSLINIPNKDLDNFIKRGEEMGESELLTPAKIAERWGISVDKLKKELASQNIQPDSQKGICSYYDISKLDKVREMLQRGR